MQVGINRFVLRQTAASPFSYYAGTWEELQQLVTRQLAITSGTPASPGRLLLVRRLTRHEGIRWGSCR